MRLVQGAWRALAKHPANTLQRSSNRQNSEHQNRINNFIKDARSTPVGRNFRMSHRTSSGQLMHSNDSLICLSVDTQVAVIEAIKIHKNGPESSHLFRAQHAHPTTSRGWSRDPLSDRWSP